MVLQIMAYFYLGRMVIEGELFFQGDKSLSHRAAILSAMACGKSTLKNYLFAEDTLNTLKAMEKLGVFVKKDGETVMVDSTGIEGWRSPKDIIDVGNSGTGARLLLGLFSGVAGLEAILDGDESLRKRPMRRVTSPLTNFGAKFEPMDYLPIKVSGQKLLPIHFQEDLGSAQVKSALILAALAAQVPLHLRETVPSRDHTEKMLIFAGVPLHKEAQPNGFLITANPPYKIEPREYEIWGDVSSAAFFVVLGLLAEKGEILIRNVLFNPYRTRYLEILKQMGGHITILPQKERCGEKGGDIIVRPSNLKGVAIEPKDIPAIIDELPILTIAGVFSTGKFSFRGAAELRLKESDRIKALVTNLRFLGVEVEEYPDGLAVEGNPERVLQGPVESFMDHRIVMSFEIAQIKSQINAKTNKDLIQIHGKNWVQTSFPDFYEKLKYLKDKKTLSKSPAMVTLDGPAGSGKSTLAKKLAQKYGFYQIDSGAIYRTLTYLAMERYGKCQLTEEQEKDFLDYLNKVPLQIVFGENREQQIYVFGKVVGDEIRTSIVSQNIGFIADRPKIRSFVNKLIQKLAEEYPVVADGRDMGTVVFPTAARKFFITADVKERAKRASLRYQELGEKYKSLQEIEQELLARDEKDAMRPDGAMKAAEDAIFLDNTGYSLEETLEIIETYLRQCPSQEVRDMLFGKAKTTLYPK